MNNKEGKELVQSHSRKQLQFLCKKYGLPANTSTLEMTKALASYFEKNLLSSTGETLCGSRKASLPTFVMSEVKPEAPCNLGQDTKRDGCKGLISPSGEEENRMRNPQMVKADELGYGACNRCCNKEGHCCSMYCFRETSNPPSFSGTANDCYMENVGPNQHADVNFASFPGETILPSSMKMFEPISSSSFEFFVHSEDGLNLSVELNSNPSEWVNKLKNGVNISHKVSDIKSGSFHEELGNLGDSNKQSEASFPWGLDPHQINDAHVKCGTSPSTSMKENFPLDLNQPDRGDGSLTSSAVEPSGIAMVMTDNIPEDQGANSLEPNFDGRDDIRSCTDDNGCSTTADLEVVNTPVQELVGNSVVNVSDCSISLVTQEYEKSKSKSGYVVREDSAPENSCSLVNSPAVVGGLLASEMPLSEALVEPEDTYCENGIPLDLVDSKTNEATEQGRLADSVELHPDDCRKSLPITVEEWERSELIDAEEGSECLQFEDSSEKTCSHIDNVEPKELSRKRTSVEIGDGNGSSKPDAKILRSSKQLGRKVTPRRSMRLVSK